MNDKNPLDDAKKAVSETVDTVSDATSDIASDAADTAKDTFEDASDAAKSTAHDASKSLSDAADDARNAANRAADKASDALDKIRRGDARDDLESSAKKTREFLSEQREKHPVAALVIVGLFGLLVGRGLTRR